MTTTTDASLGRAAFVGAALATVLAPLHALARYATEDGRADLDSPAVRAWAEPARDVLAPLLDWGSADTVYLTYGKLWAPLLVLATLCAFAVRRRRGELLRGAERWGWRLVLTGLTGSTVGVLGSYWTPLLDEAFLFAVPFLLIGMAGSGVLGASLLRQGFRPRATAVLLLLWFPAMVVLSSLVAMGAAFLPALWAWGLAGRALAETSDERVPLRV